jgi:NO-binding membrane sensor protein with MHYT domain
MREDKHDVRANLYASIIVSVLLAYAAVTLRMVARWRSRTKLRADDWLILAGLVSASAGDTSSIGARN